MLLQEHGVSNFKRTANENISTVIEPGESRRIGVGKQVHIRVHESPSSLIVRNPAVVQEDILKNSASEKVQQVRDGIEASELPEEQEVQRKRLKRND